MSCLSTALYPSWCRVFLLRCIPDLTKPGPGAGGTIWRNPTCHNRNAIAQNEILTRFKGALPDGTRRSSDAVGRCRIGELVASLCISNILLATRVSRMAVLHELSCRTKNRLDPPLKNKKRSGLID